MSKKLMFLTLIALVPIMTVVACGTEVDQEVISFTDSATENVLIALNNQDYESFRQDMDDVMLGTVNEQEFTRLFTFLNDTIGEYKRGSKNYLKSTIQGEVTAVIYTTDYTEETEKVLVTIVVSSPDEGIYQVAGLWFDSPKLREVGN